ncbi:MAG: HAMP domain-containing sensor histidine kinase [Saprospiraceae bacterium]
MQLHQSAARIMIEVAPPWYLMPWMKTLWISLCLLGLYTIFRLRTRHIIHRNKELEALILARTQTIEQDRKTIQTQNEQLKVLIALRDKTLALLGRELKQPINNLTGLGAKVAYLLRNGQYEQIEALSKQIDMYATNTRLLLSNLLKWGHITINQSQQIKEEVVVFHIVEDILEHFESIIIHKNLNIINLIPSDLTLTFDKEALAIVLRNLIHNAIKFSYQEGKIFVKHQIKNRTLLHIMVIDEGKGMSKDQLENQTELYSTQGTKGEKGSGLGIMLCRMLLKSNNAKLILYSNTPKGTVCTIETHYS